MPKFLSLAEVADSLGVSVKTVRRYIADGDLPAVRLGSTHTIRIRSEDVEAFTRPVAIAS